MRKSKTINDILLLGDSRLYEKSEIITTEDYSEIKNWIFDLSSAMNDIRENYNFGRGIAAQQLGIMKRLVFTNVKTAKIFINPKIIERSKETIELWDDCMSFPNLLVKVKRNKIIKVEYQNENFDLFLEEFKNDDSELMQHEIDHLDGI